MRDFATLAAAVMAAALSELQILRLDDIYRAATPVWAINLRHFPTSILITCANAARQSHEDAAIAHARFQYMGVATTPVHTFRRDEGAVQLAMP